MILFLLLSLLLTGCTTPLLTGQYPESCSITQPDKEGTGHTTGTFPCRLQHVVSGEAK